MIVNVIYKYRLINLNNKDFPCHGAVICNFCINGSSVWSHDSFWGIIPNNIHLTIEIIHDQHMLTNDTRVLVTVEVCLLLSVICQEYINSFGTDNGSNRSSTNNSLPCQCRIVNIGCWSICSWWLWFDIVKITSAYTCFINSSVSPSPLKFTFFSSGLCPLACLFF